MKMDMNLCNNLKSIRTRLGMSQQDLADMAGVSRQSISGVESGEHAPSVGMSLRLAKALGCKVEDLFWFEEELADNFEQTMTNSSVAVEVGSLSVNITVNGIGDRTDNAALSEILMTLKHIYDIRTGIVQNGCGNCLSYLLKLSSSQLPLEK
ncbi:helix-turn-helix domain-containing protein [Nostoc spongiaeforme FACHB-130]|uniref:Helix-turn-helix domain-containing protein n=1 Tax=Nostoc spongiaeforme FACHB-130 TaxID=1357510 RepID=A0ABR8FQ49_9NOSO|nr:helix-turn-helix domain-containing protein [Nostoc spongiaeforme FACHB-130]